MAKTEFVTLAGDVVIPATEYPFPTAPGARVEYFGKAYVVADAAQTTRRVVTSTGDQWVRTVPVLAAGGVVDAAPAGKAEPAAPTVKKTPKPAAASRAGRQLVAEDQ